MEGFVKNFEVQGIELRVPRQKAFACIADPTQLPRWTNAFAFVRNGRARMRTPNGEIDIALAVRASAEHGTVDWLMTFPDGKLATAFSRVVELTGDSCVFSFVLTPPPVALEQLEGALEAQSVTLAEELKTLKRLLERDG
jgi:hypothetical protein